MSKPVISAKRAATLRRDYGLSVEDYERLFAFQEGRCAICKRYMSIAHVDHNHRTGETRGLLCWHCNNALGKFRDNLQLLQNAAAYIQEHPVVKALGNRRFGLPGRITTNRITRQEKARKNLENNTVPADAYQFCFAFKPRKKPKPQFYRRPKPAQSDKNTAVTPQK